MRVVAWSWRSGRLPGGNARLEGPPLRVEVVEAAERVETAFEKVEQVACLAQEPEAMARQGGPTPRRVGPRHDGILPTSASGRSRKEDSVVNSAETGSDITSCAQVT